MTVAARVFHGLSGTEIRHAFLLEMKSLLTERLGKYWATRIKIDFVYRMVLDSYPAGDRQPKVSISGTVTGTGAEDAAAILAQLQRHYDRDTDFGHNVTFPKVTWMQTLDLQAFALPDTVLPDPPKVVAPAPGELDLRIRVDPPPAAGVKPEDFAPLKSSVLPVNKIEPSADARIAALEQTIKDLKAGVPLPATTDRFDGTVPPRTGDLGLFTTTGNVAVPPLPIEGSALPSPGAEHAEAFGAGSAVAPLAIPLERMILSADHPSLAEGGAGNPDAIRRETGQPVPAPRRTPGGHLVDFPLGVL